MDKVTPLKTIAGDTQKPIRIGKIEIPCFVLEGGLRVITETGLYNALDLSRTGRNSNSGKPSKDLRAKSDDPQSPPPTNRIKAATNTTELPRFAQAKWLKPHLPPKLAYGLKTRYLFQMPNGAIAHGFKAQVLTAICSAILDAYHSGSSTERYEGLIRQAEILLEGFANVGIIGLIDEATEYQDTRKASALAEILEAFIADELRPWSKEFPDAYYEEIYRLWEYTRPQHHVNHPQFIAKLTNKLIYKPLGPGILEELQRINPLLENGTRRNKHHQLLSENYGVKKLREQITRVVTLLEVAHTKEHFYRLYNSRYGSGQTYMDFTDDLDYNTNKPSPHTRGHEAKRLAHHRQPYRLVTGTAKPSREAPLDTSTKTR